MLVIRNSQIEAMARTRGVELPWQLAQCIQTSLEGSGSVTQEEALEQADAAIAAGEEYEIRNLHDLVRLSLLLGKLDAADRQSGWLIRILSDRTVTDPRQRLLRAEEELQHRRQIASSNARLVARIRAGATE